MGHMSGSPKEKLGTLPVEETVEEEREVYLRDGRKLVLREQNAEQLVEVRSESGMVEVRIRLTAEGPVLQMESARLQLKATEQVSIESANIEIKGTEKVDVSGGNVRVSGEEDVNVDAKGEVRVVGKMIYLN